MCEVIINRNKVDKNRSVFACLYGIKEKFITVLPKIRKRENTYALLLITLKVADAHNSGFQMFGNNVQCTATITLNQIECLVLMIMVHYISKIEGSSWSIKSI